MKIKDALPQFNNKTALIAVTEKENAKLYIARDGEVEELEPIEVEQENFYSDREGRYTNRELGGVIVSGRSVEEHGDAEVKKFLTKFEERFPEIVKDHNPEIVYLFSPSYIVKEVIECIPTNKRDLIETTFDGNYSDKHPFDLLEMILQYREERSVDPKSEEAQKLYDKFPDEQ